MNIKKLKEQTEKVVILFDLYDRTSGTISKDKIQKKTSEHKMNYLKKQLLRSIVNTKKTCEEEIKLTKRNLK